MNDNYLSSNEIPIIKKLYDLYLLTHKTIAIFPKHERYSLGEKIETNILEAIELIIFGNTQPKNFKDTYLLKASAKIEVLKIFFRLAMDNGFINETQYFKTINFLQEISKMLGGWIKYLRSDFVRYEDKDNSKKTKE
ncbi:MAG: four helix bundle protein [Candidatus Falkowbacteria bacterium]